MKKKILMSVGSLEIGGNEIFAMNVFRHLDRDKFSMDFVIFDDENMVLYDEIISSGAKVWTCVSKYKNKILILIDQMKQLSSILKSNEYQLIHCNSCSCIGILRSAFPAKINGHIKIITHSHNVGQNSMSWLSFLARYAFKLLISKIADYGFACSIEAGNSKYTRSFIASEKYRVINNAIDVGNYIFCNEDRELIRNELGLDENTILMGTIGRLDFQKNHSFMLDMFSDFKKNSDRKAKLIIIGEGILEKELKNQVKHLKIEEDVIFAGRKNNANRYYNAMDCFILTSNFEGLPFVLIEAQTNGLQCFVSDTISKDVDISETIKFIPLDTEKWRELLISNGFKRISKNNIQKVIDKYDIKKELEVIENIYLDLC